MTKRQLQFLTRESFQKNDLDQNMVSAIAQMLTRVDLKKYIRMLKMHIAQSTVYITTASQIQDQQLKDFQDIFNDKKIITDTDPSFLAGVKVTNNDIIYELNLKHNLDEQVEFLEN